MAEAGMVAAAIQSVLVMVADRAMAAGRATAVGRATALGRATAVGRATALDTLVGWAVVARAEWLSSPR